MSDEYTRYNIRKETYVDQELSDKLDDAADDYGMSVSEILREGARRQLQQLEAQHD